MSLQNDDSWIQTVKQLDEWMERNRPSTVLFSEEQKLKHWVYNQHQRVKDLPATDPEYQKWFNFMTRHKSFFMSTAEWFNKLRQLDEWLSVFCKQPSLHSSNIAEKTLAKWVYDQHNTYKKLHETDSRRKQWVLFVEENWELMKPQHRDNWMETLDSLVAWMMDNENHLPKRRSGNLLEKELAGWVFTQKSSFNRKVKSMTEGNPRHTLWTEFCDNQGIPYRK